MQTTPDAALSGGANASSAPATPDLPARKPLWRNALETFIAIGMVFVLVQALFSIVTIDGDAMSPTLRAGQTLVVSRTPYLINMPRRGDIVALRSRINPAKMLLLRVVGLPGERLNVKGAQVSINGQPLYEPYLPESIDRIGVSTSLIGQYDIGHDEYFLLNDNRANSDDSRSSGLFTRADLAGRAWLIIWPLDNIQFMGPLPDSQPAQTTGTGAGP